MSRFVHQPRYTVALTPADVGERVMVRYALAIGAPATGAPAVGAGVPVMPSFTDAVGDLLHWDHGMLRIATRTGFADVAETALVAGKRVPPARPAHAREASVAEVQRMSSLSWQAMETERFGGWRLRAGGGFTGRANSVLPLGDPGIRLDHALAYVERWYEDRGLTPRFQLPMPGAAGLSETLAERGWPLTDSADVMVGDVADALERLGEPRRGLPPVTVADLPSAGWLGAYHYRGTSLPPAGYAVLTHHSDAGFASVTENGVVVAIARAAVDDAWLGFSAVEVAESARRRGLGRHVMDGLLRWGHARGARYAHLQVDVNNEAGRALYAGMGFTFHHRYAYRVEP